MAWTNKLNAFIGKALGDWAPRWAPRWCSSVTSSGCTRALAAGSSTSAELAANTGTNERYVRGGWRIRPRAATSYDAERDVYYLNAERALCLADDSGPIDLPAACSIVGTCSTSGDRAVANFRSGAGMEWGEHHPVCSGHRAVLRAGYSASLLAGMAAGHGRSGGQTGRRGPSPMSGCGHGDDDNPDGTGVSAFGFVGIDYHEPSVVTAREHAAHWG